MFISKSELEDIRFKMLALQCSRDKLFEDVNELKEIIKKTNIYNKTKYGCSYFDAELTNDSLQDLKLRVAELERPKKKKPVKKKVKSGTKNSK